jgi:hypothetical protein
MQVSASKFPAIVSFRAPAGFSQALATAAALRHQSSSDYLRQLVLREMQRDGVRLRDGRVEKNSAPTPIERVRESSATSPSCDQSKVD